jgi:hypothetical protein
MYDLTASKGLAAFILMRESREHQKVYTRSLNKLSRWPIEMRVKRAEWEQAL